MVWNPACLFIFAKLSTPITGVDLRDRKRVVCVLNQNGQLLGEVEIKPVDEKCFLDG